MTCRCDNEPGFWKRLGFFGLAVLKGIAECLHRRDVERYIRERCARGAHRGPDMQPCLDCGALNDPSLCPRCETRMEFDPAGWLCANCGFGRGVL